MVALVIKCSIRIDSSNFEFCIAKATGGSISCCIGGRFGNFTPNPDPECLPIPIPSNDPVYSNVNCMNFVRNTYGLNLDGTIPTSRQQVWILNHGNTNRKKINLVWNRTGERPYTLDRWFPNLRK